MTQLAETNIEELRRERITDNQIAQLFEALEANSSVAAAAAGAGIRVRTAYRILARYDAQLDGVKKYLGLKAYHAAEQWIKATETAADKGDHRPAKDLLLAVKAIEPIDSQGNSGIVINIGTPDNPIAIPAQILDLSPSDKS